MWHFRSSSQRKMHKYINKCIHKQKEWRKPTSILGYCQSKQSLHYKRPEGEEKGPESLYKEILPENSPSLEMDVNIQVREVLWSPFWFNSKKILLKYIITKLSKIEDRENNTNKRGKNTRQLPYAVSGCLRRNVAGQERVGWDIRCTERKKLPTKQLKRAKFFQSEEDIDFPRCTKAEGVC